MEKEMLAKLRMISEDLNAISEEASELLGMAESEAEICASTWRITSEIRDDKIFVSVWNGDRLVTRGFSRVIPEKWDTDVGMAQCFSYAAHMAFKNIQKKEGLEDAG